jgi:hypothetical protein
VISGPYVSEKPCFDFLGQQCLIFIPKTSEYLRAAMPIKSNEYIRANDSISQWRKYLLCYKKQGKGILDAR